jgi:acetolactate synthase-1/2/3 large subunit
VREGGGTPDEWLISGSLKTLCEAKRPVIIAGGGVISANASKELTQLATRLNIPVTTTMMGVGAYSSLDETNLGMLGVLGNYWANQAISQCDVLLAIGTRFNDRIVAPIKNCSKTAKIIYVDIEPSEFSKTFEVAYPIIGDAKDVLQSMLTEIDNYKTEAKTEWIEQIEAWKAKKVIPHIPSEKMHAHTVLEKIYERTKEYSPIVATEVGQHQLWTVQSFKFIHPRKLLTSGGLGTMGFGFPAAMGACLAEPNSLVLNIAGDGSIQMNIQELATCVEYNLPVKVMIMNNGYLGMVRQWQEKLFEKHYCGTEITSPDFVKVAEAYGAKGIRVTKEEEIDAAIKEAIAYPGPVFIDFIIEPFEVVYPYISAT